MTAIASKDLHFDSEGLFSATVKGKMLVETRVTDIPFLFLSPNLLEHLLIEA